MGSKLYVGNLSYNTTSSDLEQLFAAHGTVQSAEVIARPRNRSQQGFRVSSKWVATKKPRPQSQP